MKQYCMTFKIDPEKKKEYKKIHSNIWPEYAKAVREAGISNQSIFYKDDGTLFIYFESENPEKSLEKIENNPLNIKWQKEMEKFLIKNKEYLNATSDLEGTAILKYRPEALALEQLFYQE